MLGVCCMAIKAGLGVLLGILNYFHFGSGWVVVDIDVAEAHDD